MNDLDEFAEVALAIFVALTLLIWFLTYLEQTLIQPVTKRRAQRGVRRRENSSLIGTATPSWQST
jgi:hypothetical protein